MPKGEERGWEIEFSEHITAMRNGALKTLTAVGWGLLPPLLPSTFRVVMEKIKIQDSGAGEKAQQLHA